jgi:hypothetical protein
MDLRRLAAGVLLGLALMGVAPAPTAAALPCLTKAQAIALHHGHASWRQLPWGRCWFAGKTAPKSAFHREVAPHHNASAPAPVPIPEPRPIREAPPPAAAAAPSEADVWPVLTEEDRQRFRAQGVARDAAALLREEGKWRLFYRSFPHRD